MPSFTISTASNARTIERPTFIGEHDWYREGCKFLTKPGMQHDTLVVRRRPVDTWPVVSTSFPLFSAKDERPFRQQSWYGPGND